MPKTLNKENEYGGWFSPVDGEICAYPVTVSGFGNDYEDGDRFHIRMKRNGVDYAVEAAYLVPPGSNYRTFSLRLEKLQLGPTYIQAQASHPNEDEWLPDLGTIYVLTPPEK